jgi:hypothetical protein
MLNFLVPSALPGSKKDDGGAALGRNSTRPGRVTRTASRPRIQESYVVAAGAPMATNPHSSQ